MIIALTPPSFERMLNYENYETIGDSILKLVSTLYVYQIY